MKYLPTAFAQLDFALKLYNYALEGRIKLEELNTSFPGKEGGMFVLSDRIFTSAKEMISAFEKNVCIAFGAAAITLDKSRDEAGLKLPGEIHSDQDQFIALVYQIRNAFAHDIAEPKWEIRKDYYKREYNFADIKVDLSDKHGQLFDYHSIGGIETLFKLRDYGETIWGSHDNR